MPILITLLSDRRVTRPYGLDGGEDGHPGRNMMRNKEGKKEAPGQCSLKVEAGDELIIETPSGGGYGKPENPDTQVPQT